MAISKRDREKMFKAYREKQSINYVTNKTNFSYNTVKSWSKKDKWDDRLARENLAIEDAKVEVLKNHFTDEMEMFRSILLRVGNSIFQDKDKRFTLSDLKTAMEIMLLYGGIDPSTLGSKGQLNVTINNNTPPASENTECTLSPSSTILTSEERTSIYKMMNKAKERTLPIFNNKKKEEIVEVKEDCIIVSEDK